VAVAEEQPFLDQTQQQQTTAVMEVVELPLASLGLLLLMLVVAVVVAEAQLLEREVLVESEALEEIHQ